MPVMGGKEATHIIRNKPPFSTDARLRHTPIIAMGAHMMASISDFETVRKMGCDDFLPKPVRVPHLRRILLQYSRHHPRHVPGSGMVMAPVWGPVGLRAYRGPRSRI